MGDRLANDVEFVWSGVPPAGAAASVPLFFLRPGGGGGGAVGVDLEDLSLDFFLPKIRLIFISWLCQALSIIFI